MSSADRGVCPVCSGSKRMPVPDHLQNCTRVLYGYDSNTKTIPCTNCGGQYQFGSPSGTVRLRPDGSPCEHNYGDVRKLGNCYHSYTCTHCGDSYRIDSGD